MLNFKPKLNRGMTYVELIVVLSIFATLSSVSLFNYSKFQGKVNIKNLANDIAIRIVQAQRESLTGKFSASAALNWKPSYGLYFNVSTASNSKKFVYFTDANNSNSCDTSGCISPYSVTGEVNEIVSITKNNSISSIQLVGSGCPANVTNISIIFKRPNTAPQISSSPAVGCTISQVILNITSPQGATAKVKVYASGLIQIS